MIDYRIIAPAAAVGSKLLLKAFFISKMAGLKAAIAHYAGAQAANISVTVLAAGAAAAYWEKNVKGNSDDRAIQAAMSKGMSEEAARAVVRYIIE